MPLEAGAWCRDLRFDVAAPRTAMVNARFADVYGGAGQLLGRHITFDQDSRPPLEIVGVVGNVAEDGVGAPAAPYVYACESAGTWPDPDYLARTAGEPTALLASIRQTVHRIAPSRSVFGVTTVDQVMRNALDQPRLDAGLVTVFAAAAVLLASIGLYAVLMLLVVERTRELGVRTALGASPASLVGLVLARAGWLIGVGMAAGLAMLAAVEPLFRAMLFGVARIDLPALGGAIAALAVVGLTATTVPAARAGATDPMGAIRVE